MIMSNIMNLVDVKNHVHRSGFDLSRRNCFTAKVGEILPVFCEEVLPGDKWRINMREFMRTAPVQTATFGRVRQYYDFYFVPYSLMWDKFDAWVMQTKNAYHSKSLVAPADEFSGLPYCKVVDIYNYYSSLLNQDSSNPYNDNPDTFGDTSKATTVAYQMDKLLEYLGYPRYEFAKDENIENMAINVFPLLAYQKIYQDYFRFSQWEDAAPWTYNLDFVLGENQLNLTSSQTFEQMYGKSNLPSMFTLRYCNLDKDYLTGLLPSPQYGDTAIAGPLSGGLSTNSYAFNLNGVLGLRDLSQWVDDSTRRVLGIGEGSVQGRNIVVKPLDGDGPNVTYKASQNATFTSLADGSVTIPNAGDNLGLSVLILRQAEALQKWKEITLSGSPDYREQLEKHWNVKVSADNSYLCRYLGGFASDIDISEVVNTNLDGTDSAAIIAGKGISAGNGNIDFDSHQYGILMCVYHAKPIVEWNYNYCIPRMLMKTKATDFAIPEFDNIGMQQVVRCEFANNDIIDPFKPLGYAPRYVEYKTSFDRSCGEFNKTLRPWVIEFDISNVGSGTSVGLTYKTFKVPAKSLDNMFAFSVNESTETDQFYNTIYFKASVVRNLSRSGLPY